MAQVVVKKRAASLQQQQRHHHPSSSLTTATPMLTAATSSSNNSNSISMICCRKAILVLVIAMILWVLYEQGTEISLFTMSSNPRTTIRDDPYRHHYCWDEDDPIEDVAIKQQHDCQCPDPTKPLRRIPPNPAWNQRHQTLIRDALYSATLQQQQHNNNYELDVVLLGDSITERWNRTGRNPDKNDDDDVNVDRDNNRAVFDRYFSAYKHGNSSTTTTSITTNTTPSTTSQFLLNGLALGTSGDICTELLWHLHNGMMPLTLRPKVWLLLIGTNDIGRSGCSKRTVLAGILQVAEYIRHQRGPGTRIILHALLPRNDVYRPATLQMDYTLNRYWRDIVWINTELAKFGELHHEWTYLNCNHLFLINVTADTDPADGNGDTTTTTTTTATETPTTTSTMMINKELMPDALHPNMAGYEVWAPCIVNHVLKVINN